MANTLKKAEKEMLAKAEPATRKFFYNAIQNDYPFVHDMNILFNDINEVEKSTYAKWHQKCLADMRRVKLHTALPELYNKIASPEVSVKQALTILRRAYVIKPYEAKRKQVGKMLSLIQNLSDREDKLYHLAQERLEDEPTSKAMAVLAENLGRMGARDSEDLLYTKQSIKHVNSLRGIGAQPSIHELYQALEPRFAFIEELYDKQIGVALKSCLPDGTIPLDVKDIIFDFIQESVPVAGYFDARLIECIFKNGQISERAFQLFTDMEPIIKQQGISPMIYYRAKAIANSKKLVEKKLTELSLSDLNILRLIEKFRSKF